jgi:ribosomal-protein-alanine N-acetyltransferase
LRQYYEQVVLSPKHLVLAVIDKESDAHIGNVGLHEINYLFQNAEMGICLGEKQYWGRGRGKEAIALICQHGFRQLNLQRIELGVLTTHRSAIKTYETIGFKHEGVKRKKVYKHGEFIDVVIMGMLKDELNLSLIE